MRRAIVLLVVTTIAAGCGFMPRLPTSTPEPTNTPSPIPTPAPSLETEAPSDDPAPTPGEESVPRFAVGSLVATNAPGLRIRSRPGTDQRVITSLGLGAELLVGLGPILVDGLGWYLVRDADDADPAFGEGWVAAGFEPDPFLVAAGVTPEGGPFLGGFAETSSGEFGPTELPARRIALRWIASAARTEICNFALDLATESGEPIRAVRTPVGSFPASGELPVDFFRANDLEGRRVFVHVESTCSWAVAFWRAEADAAPS